MSRGGKRPGSGRKATGKASVTVAFRVSLDTKEKLESLKKQGINIRQKFEDLIKELAE